MGLDCISGPKDAKRSTARRTSRELDRKLSDWSKPFRNAIKILLLGAGEAGKTTIIKQMKILHISGFTQKERLEQVDEVKRNVFEAIQCLCSNLSSLNIELETDILKEAAKHILDAKQPFPKDLFDKIEILWKSAAIGECLKRSSEFQLLDSAKYFLDKITEIKKDGYVPSDKDILHCRRTTTGIQKVEFCVKIPKRYGGGSQDFWMFDVGGQRGERRKWIQAFDGIHAVLFLVATSSFDQNLREDGETNRLREAIELFKDVWDSRYLRDSGVILFLNKQDVLERKLQDGQRLEKFFENFSPFDEKEESIEEYIDRARGYIRDLFLETTRKKRLSALDRKLSVGPGIVYTPAFRDDEPRECYWHYTTAVDTTNIRNVFNDVHSMVISWNLKELGLQ